MRQIGKISADLQEGHGPTGLSRSTSLPIAHDPDNSLRPYDRRYTVT
jgi:hypothetical protein